jgi:hypothetical protein
MSKEQISERRKIRKEVKYLIDKGEPKQQILEELSQLYKDKIAIMKQLEATPSRIMKYKFRTHNYFLAALLMLVLVLDSVALSRLQWGDWIIDANLVLNVALDVIFLVYVLLFRIEIYTWIAARAVVTLLTIMAAHTEYYQIDILVFVSLTLIVVSFVLGMTLGVKLCPPRIPKTVEVNVGENQKINKTIYVFPD